MPKVLFSWIAPQNDFIRSNGSCSINQTGPNYLFHAFEDYDYDQHILLCSAASQERDSIAYPMAEKIRADFKHQVEVLYLDIKDVIDLNEIQQVIQELLLSYRHCEIDIYISTGTNIMRIVWVLLHKTLKLKTQLIQTRHPNLIPQGKKYRKLYLDIAQDTVPRSLIIHENEQKNKLKKQPISNDFCLVPSLSTVYNQALKVAQTDVTALIVGESGTGKEHLARYIHQQSRRKQAPFVVVNCAALGDNLLESRLFGHAKGAFTGAFSDHMGLFEQAEKGTIFLDEIGDISPYMQMSLLRVLQQKEIQPIGKPVQKIEVRIIAATNADLTEKCKKGTFRWDLYYRLAVLELELPTLRSFPVQEKKELLSFLIQQLQQTHQRAIQLAPSTQQLLLQYPFEGNIRELEHALQRLYVLTDQIATPDLLPKRIIEQPTLHSTKLKDVEKHHIEKILHIHQGNLSQTAKALAIAVNTLKSKIANYHIE